MPSGDELLLSIDRIAFETPDILLLDLTMRGGGELSPWTPGAHIDLMLPSGKIRQYSLCSDPADLTRYRVAVLRETAGRGGSVEIHEVAREGVALSARGPRNHFELVDAPGYLFIAGGIGITPILPMIRVVEKRGLPWRLIYGGRSRGTMGFLDEIAERQGGDVLLLPEDEFGRPDLDELLSNVGSGAAVYGCGPSGMLAALLAASDRNGIAEALHIERLSAAEDVCSPAEKAIDTPFEVELKKSGVVLCVPGDRSLGSVLQEAGIPVSFSCEEGYCGSCETRVLAGVPDHRDTILNEEERKTAGVMMVCVGRASTSRLVLDL